MSETAPHSGEIQDTQYLALLAEAGGDPHKATELMALAHEHANWVRAINAVSPRPEFSGTRDSALIAAESHMEQQVGQVVARNPDKH